MASVNEALKMAKGELEKTNEKLDAALTDAELQRKRANRLTYVSQINLAERAKQENKHAQALRILESLSPREGDSEDLRGPEWYHLWQRCHGYHLAFDAHDQAVTQLSFSPEGGRLVSVARDGSVKVWESRTGRRVVSVKPAPGGIAGVRLSQGGRFLTIVRPNGQGEGWELVDGQARVLQPLPDGPGSDIQNLRAELKATLGRKGKVATGGSDQHFYPTVFTLTPDLRFGVWRHEEKNRDAVFDRLEIRELQTDRQISGFREPGCRVLNMAFRPDGKLVAFSSRDEKIWTWELPDGKPEPRFSTLAPAITLGLSHDGRLLAAGGLDGKVWIWQLDRVVGVHKLDMGAGTGVAFSPDGSLLAGFSRFGFKIWRVDDHQVHFKQMGAMGYPRGAFHPHTGILFAGRRLFQLNLEEAKEFASIPGDTNFNLGMDFSPDRNLIALADGRSLAIADATTGKVVRTIPKPAVMDRWLTCVSFNLDGTRLAAGSAGSEGPLHLQPGSVIIWDTRSWQQILHLRSPLSGVWRLAYSPDGRFLAGACGNYKAHQSELEGEIKLWDALTGREIMTLGGHIACAFDICFSRDGKRLASAGGKSPLSASGQRKDKNPGEVKLWDLTHGQELLTIRELSVCSTGVSFTPDGKSLAACDWDGTIHLYGELPLRWALLGIPTGK